MLQNSPSGWLKKLSEGDPFEGEEGSNIWTLSGRDPFSAEPTEREDIEASSGTNNDVSYRCE